MSCWQLARFDLSGLMVLVASRSKRSKPMSPGCSSRRRLPMPRLRDGVIKRGGSWSYVIRVPDPATGVSRPRWVGGFDTEEAAKAARDEARVRARNGQYVNRSTSTVAGYLAEWL